MSNDNAPRAESPPRGVDSDYRPGNFKDPSPIVYPAAANGAVSNFKIQPNLIAMLPVFKRHEEPYVHLWEFFSIADTYQVNNTTKDGKNDDNYNLPNNTQQQNHSYIPKYEGGDSSNFQQNYQQQSSYQQRPQQNKNQGQGPSNGQQSNVDQKFDLILSELAKSNKGTNLKFESLSKSVVNLESQMGQLAEEVHKREAGKLPSNPTLNPKNKPCGHEHVNMVTSLRNGKKADNVKSNSELVNDLLKDFPKPPTWNFEATESPKVGKGGVSSTTTPYPTALEKSTSARLAKKGPQSEDMWETFKQALLDLGACINILPASLVDKYDFESLQKTVTIISLAGRSTKNPKCILEDIIVNVDDFYYPVDFFVMDTESPYKDVQPNIILGRPFLATIDARINCQTGAMDIAFGNRKIRLNFMNLDRTLENLHYVDSEKEIFDGMTFHEKEEEFQMIEQEFLLSLEETPLQSQQGQQPTLNEVQEYFDYLLVHQDVLLRVRGSKEDFED
nr:hypothetical protein [Tanacetum cinerariifolium]